MEVNNYIFPKVHVSQGWLESLGKVILILNLTVGEVQEN